MACVWESFSISCIGSFYPGPSGRAWRGFSKKATDRASRDSQPSSFWSMIPACAEMCMTRSTSWWYLIRHSCNKSHVQEIKTSVGPPTGAEHLQCIDVDVDFTAQNLCKFGCCRERCNWQSKKGMSWWIVIYVTALFCRRFQQKCFDLGLYWLWFCLSDSKRWMFALNLWKALPSLIARYGKST